MPGQASLELWGGLECTVARVGDDYRDQIRATGHQDRPDDLDRVARLGIRTLRYPILWERISPERPDCCDWAWHDARLGRMRELGLRPIAGLVHHGSGPSYTDLLSPDFPQLLAQHAERVARRYPWIDLYTPVNEPLTTARFSCLYGHWYPHARGYREFLLALVNQCRATLLAMRAVRQVNPAAGLVQTDDFGRVFSTPSLAYQADHENERRWLTFDLLFGRVDRSHPWRRIFLDHGVAERDLDLFLDGEAKPDIVGINHYLTSERFLDERLERYPSHHLGSNGHQAYADVEAVRMRMEAGQLGPGPRLREVWERYRAPVAITEVHHGCTRDEQLRWLNDVWTAADAERRAGADIRAVTAWALFGTVDWNSLLTRQAGIYEAGAFDSRGGVPRATAIAGALGQLARSGSFDHPALDGPGWWRRETRFYRPTRPEPAAVDGPSPRTVLVMGPDGPLRRALLRVAAERGLALALARSEPLTEEALEAGRVWAVVEVGGSWDGLARSRAAGRRWDGREAARVEALCQRTGRRFLTFLPAPPREAGRRSPSGGSELTAAAGALVIRSGPLFGPWEPDALVAAMLADIAEGRPIHLEAGSPPPAYLPDLVHVALDLLVDGETGEWRLANPPVGDLETFARRLAEQAGAPDHTVVASRPAESSPVARARGPELMPDMAGAIDRYLRDAEFDWRRPQTHLAAAE